MIIDDELFWGKDQIENMEQFLLGKDPLAGMDITKTLHVPRGIDRKLYLKNNGLP